MTVAEVAATLKLNQQTVRNWIFSTVITPRPVMTGSADGASTHRPARKPRRCHARTAHERNEKGSPLSGGASCHRRWRGSPEQPAKIRAPHAAALCGPRVASRSATQRLPLLAPGPAGVGAATLRMLATRPTQHQRRRWRALLLPRHRAKAQHVADASPGVVPRGTVATLALTA
jgi:hypothetical protein